MTKMANVCRRAVVALGAVAVLSATSVEAAPLGLTPSEPDITVFDLVLNYNAATDQFTASGGVAYSAVDSAGNNVAITPGSGTYSLSAPINSAGTLSGPGSLLIRGNIGSGVQNLLGGVITAFGFAPDGGGGATFEFLADVNPAQTAAALGFGPRAGVIMTAFPGSLSPNFSGFQVNFSGTADTSDNFAVPEPVSLSLFALGAAAFGLRRRRR